ncbi:MAG TPA: hypothetical protein VHE61_18380 [Opitutaceae bacterium]|nr:hypothetical protein [Opitutaceae bacterium]
MKTTLPRPSPSTPRSPRSPRPTSTAGAPVRIVQFGSALPASVVDWSVPCPAQCRAEAVCAHWGELSDVFSRDDLRYVISSTKPADLGYVPEPIAHGVCPVSFAARVAALLYRRFVAVHADPAKGLVFLPTEPLEHNGDTLRQSVSEHARNWALPGTFSIWIREANRFLNTSIDIDGASPRWRVESPVPMTDLPFARAGIAVEWSGRRDGGVA